jgi:hypothetical protein
MSQPNLTLKISFESLVDTISNLSVEDKQKLWEILDDQLHPSYSIANQRLKQRSHYLPVNFSINLTQIQ